MFDGPIPFREFVANIDSKLDLVPRYRQVAVPPPFNLGYPTWEYDPDFDIKRHIFRVRLKAPGGEAELEALASRLLSQVLDRGKPLWEIHVVDGLQDGRGALIVRIHHALADGVAGAALLRIMLDPTPEASHAVTPAADASGGSPARGAHARRADRRRHSKRPGKRSGRRGGPAQPGRRAAQRPRQRRALQELATLLPELLQPPERFPFNKPCSGDRKFCWTEVDFSQVQAIRAALGGKVNDCILSVVVRAIARYIRLHGEKVNGRFLRVVCPVNLRGDEQGESLGNRITFLPVVLPLDVRDPVEMLRAVSTRMEIMKSVRAAELIAIGASCLGTTPAPVQELFWRGLPMVPLPLPLLNMICTNVPGSPTPLYTVGRRLLASYPHVPTGYELGAGRRGAELRRQALLRSYRRRPRGARRGAVARLHPGLFPGAVQGCRSEDARLARRNARRGKASGSRRNRRSPLEGAVPTNGAVRGGARAPPRLPSRSTHSPATGAAVEVHAVEAEPVLV